MRFTFLGTGTSAGVPAIGCACPVCSSDDPRDRRLRTSACLRWTDPGGRPRTLLLDAGPDLRQQALRERLDRLDSILITHNHVDHVFGLDEVRRFNAVMNAPIDVHAEPRVLDDLRRVYRHIFEPERNVQRSFVASLIPHAVGPAEPFDLHGLRITPLRLLHGRLPVLGYRIDATPPLGAPFLPLAWCTDVSAIPPETWPHLRGLGTLVLDALRHRHHPTHFTLGQAVSVAHELAAGRTFFVHMSHDLAHADTNADLPEGMALAHDGLTLGPDGPRP